VRDTCTETPSSRFEIHGALEGENGGVRGVAGAEVYYGGGEERAACAVGEDECWGVVVGFGCGGVVVADDGFRDGVVGDGEGCVSVGFS
jgi:hypothetical protein